MSKLLKVEIKLDTSDTPRLTSYFGYWATETLPGFVSTHTDDITPQTSSRLMTVEDGGPRSRTSLGRCDQRWELFRSNIISYLICLHTCASKYVSLLQAGRRLRGGEFTHSSPFPTNTKTFHQMFVVLSQRHHYWWTESAYGTLEAPRGRGGCWVFGCGCCWRSFLNICRLCFFEYCTTGIWSDAWWESTAMTGNENSHWELVPGNGEDAASHPSPSGTGSEHTVIWT